MPRWPGSHLWLRSPRLGKALGQRVNILRPQGRLVTRCRVAPVPGGGSAQEGGALPGGLCELVDTAAGNANLAYNRFHAANSRVRACAMALDPDGGATQTIAPRDVTVSAIATDSLTLTWRPISYTADGGGYQVLTAPQPAGPYTLHGQTPDKSANEYVIDGLTPGTTYFVAVRTFTPSHANQENDLTSESAGVAATTAYDGDPVLLMVYFPADNDLSPYVPFVVERIRRGTLVNPNVQVTMLTDRLGTDNTRFLVIANGTITVTNRVEQVRVGHHRPRRAGLVPAREPRPLSGVQDHCQPHGSRHRHDARVRLDCG